MKKCDHTSVGIVVLNNNRILLIQRAKFPAGMSIPAGHVDDHGSFEKAAADELFEEVGLKADKLVLLIEGRKENPCRREDGTWHEWKIFQAEGASGELVPSADEAKSFIWADEAKLAELGERTEKYRRGEITEEEWLSSPGLEPVMYDWFKSMELI